MAPPWVRIELALDEIIEDWTSSQTARAAQRAQAMLKIARKQNVHDPHRMVRDNALTELVGLRLLELVGGRRP